MSDTDLTKLIYICPPFKGVRTSTGKASYVPLRCIWGGETPGSWDLYYTRDSLGLGWLSVKRNNYTPSATSFNLKGLDFNKDQMFRGWLPTNLCIRSRKSREQLLTQIGKQSVLWFIENPTKNNVCIPRVCIFKEHNSSLSYGFEIIDGDDPHTVACSIGDENFLENEKYSAKNLLYPPMSFTSRRTRGHSSGRIDDDRHIPEGDSEIEDNDEEDIRPSTPDDRERFSHTSNRRFNYTDPREEAEKSVF